MMGYCYDYNKRLCCDACGKSGGVRKRTCTAKVLWDSHRSDTRHSVNYCYPPALCADCFKAEGGNKAIHADCKEKAAQEQAKHDAKQARLDAGEHLLISGSSQRGENGLTGYVEATFAADKWADHKELLVPKDLYEQVRVDDLSYEQVQELVSA